jgi:hypothetical protein
MKAYKKFVQRQMQTVDFTLLVNFISLNKTTARKYYELINLTISSELSTHSDFYISSRGFNNKFFSYLSNEEKVMIIKEVFEENKEAFKLIYILGLLYNYTYVKINKDISTIQDLNNNIKKITNKLRSNLHKLPLYLYSNDMNINKNILLELLTSYQKRVKHAK